MSVKTIFSLIFYYYLTSNYYCLVNGCLNDPRSPQALGQLTGDTSIKEGTPFVINCTLTKEQAKLWGKINTFNSSNIIFEFERNRVNNSQIIRPNGRTAYINISKSTIYDSGYYYCYIGVQKKLSLVCSMHLEVGRK